MPHSLYVHIPFCLKRCVYCDFVSGIYDPQKEDVYIKALKQEISKIPHNVSFETLYIGGGTPTALSTGSLQGLVSHIFRHCKFTKDHESTIEVNPGTVNRDKLKAVCSSGIDPAPQHGYGVNPESQEGYGVNPESQEGYGVNRISIGIQSFNDDELEALGRLHTAEEAEKAVSLAKEAGFENIGIDLIYGIPGQSVGSWARTIERAVQLGPKHISTYELTVEKNTLLYEQMEKGGLKRPGEDEIIKMYDHAIDFLTASGFTHYEISNFSMPGYECRHNLNYWDRGEYYGAGLGAHSFMDARRSYNTKDIVHYIQVLSENRAPVEGTEVIGRDKALLETFFLGLRKTQGINLEKLSDSYGEAVLKSYEERIIELQQAGLLEIHCSNRSKNNYLRLTRKGLVLSNEVFVRLM